MASRSSEPTVVPIWFVVWCLVVAAIWLTPARLIDQFVVGPLVNDFLDRTASEGNISARHLSAMRLVFVQQTRFGASAIAVLYLLVRALTARWRGDEADS